MATAITCPTCGHKSTLAQDKPGPEVRCSACLNLILFQPSPAPLSPQPSADPAAAASPNKTILAQPERMIRYTCPRCKKSLESPASFAGRKLHCPDCNQRLQIPQPATPAEPPVNKTILATAQEFPPATELRAPPPIPVLELAESDERISRTGSAPATERQYCLECGADLTHRGRVQICADCQAVFCSAGCHREHNRHAHAPPPRRRSREMECARCGSTATPYTITKISDAGWITFIILLILFFPLCWIGLLMTEARLTCVDCGARWRGV
jgi:DNA-directed RNA polymerase subunit RPC12/RpoP